MTRTRLKLMVGGFGLGLGAVAAVADVPAGCAPKTTSHTVAKMVPAEPPVAVPPPKPGDLPLPTLPAMAPSPAAMPVIPATAPVVVPAPPPPTLPSPTVPEVVRLDPPAVPVTGDGMKRVQAPPAIRSFTRDGVTFTEPPAPAPLPPVVSPPAEVVPPAPPTPTTAPSTPAAPSVVPPAPVMPSGPPLGDSVPLGATIYQDSRLRPNVQDAKPAAPVSPPPAFVKGQYDIANVGSPKPAPVTPAAAVEPAKELERKLKVILHMGDGRPRFEVRDGEEVYLKIASDRVDVKSPTEKDAKGAPAIMRASGAVRFVTPGGEGTCNELTVHPGTGLVTVSGGVKFTYNWGQVQTTVGGEQMTFRLGSMPGAVPAQVSSRLE